VQLLREPVLDHLVGLGTGSLRESFDALRAGGARFYVSGMSSKRGGSSRTGMPSPRCQASSSSSRSKPTGFSPTDGGGSRCRS
jgi:hypothetical protein